MFHRLGTNVDLSPQKFEIDLESESKEEVWSKSPVYNLELFALVQCLAASYDLIGCYVAVHFTTFLIIYLGNLLI